MQFLVPTFLFAALAIAIPILIHLFWFRKFKPIYFTNVRFLKEIKEETASRSRLRNLLVLLARILTILCLVAAFAQPFLPRGDSAASGPKSVSVYIDNSFSMNAQSKDISLLEQAKMKAKQIVEGYAASDRFQILTNDFSGTSQRLVDQAEALSLIDEVSSGPSVSPLQTVIARQRQILGAEKERKQISYLLSDFQDQVGTMESYSDTAMTVHAIPFQAIREQNIGIDSIWLEEPVLLAQQPGTIIVRLQNYGTETVEQVRLALLESGQEKPVGSLTIPGNSVIHDTIIYTPQQSGWQSLEFFINDYPIQFDDRYFAAIQVLDRLQVLVIHDATPNPFLQRGLQGISALQTNYQPGSRLEYDRLASNQLIILDGLPELSSGLRMALLQYMEKGGNVLCFPPSKRAQLPGYSEFLQQAGARTLNLWEEKERQVGQINTSSFIFRDVYTNPQANLNLPSSQGNYASGNAGIAAEERLLMYRDGAAMLSRYNQQSGNLYLSVAPLDENWSSLAKSGEVFIPMLYKMALSGNSARPLGYSIGKDEEVVMTLAEVRNNEDPMRMRSADYEFIPRQRFVSSDIRLGIPNDLPLAASYQLMGGGETLQGMIALNYDRRESVQQFLEKGQLEEAGYLVPDQVALADLSSWVGEKERGVVLWRWFVILALVFLAVEMVLLRLWKP